MSGNTIISIEGNIGSGKSTILSLLKKKVNDNNIKNQKIIFLKEPVDEWSKITDENGITMLESFYSNPNEYGFSFQMMAYISRLKILKEIYENNTNTIIITERCLFTDRYIFAQMLYDNNNIKLINFKVYVNWFDTFVNMYPIHKYIYVKTDPNICYDRINKRSRLGENNISLEYLTNCDAYHESMLNIMHKDVPKLVIDGNKDNSDLNIVNEWITEIFKYIH